MRRTSPKGATSWRRPSPHENQAGNHYDGENDDYPAWEDEDDNYVFLAEGDLDEVMDEKTSCRPLHRIMTPDRH